MIARFHPLPEQAERPAALNNPFDYEPHPLCKAAARQVCLYINKVEAWQADLAAGKMLGVLVCVDGEGQLGFLAAYSGLLAGRNDWDYFVPPVFDAQQPDGHFKQTERRISAINAEVAALTDGSPAAARRAETLKQQRRQLSEELQQWLFRQYRVLNMQGQAKDLVDIWHDYHQSERLRRRFPLPPGGSGDCCAPKLLQYAFGHGLRPLAIAEFWQGASPRGEIRHHGHYYPACSGKCKPILSWMLGQQPQPQPQPGGDAVLSAPAIIYDDGAIAVISKPAGLLSVPGRSQQPSVVSLLRQRFPHAQGPMIVHRLDMDTSGLMVVALTAEAYHGLQRQFLERTVEKRYVALLQQPSPQVLQRLRAHPSGTISLPLRPDPLDRPRQVVDPLGGKAALTRYEVLSLSGSHPLLALTPLTGRTHQLRIHCAHADGLGCPILGDRLYGEAAGRLCLHAERLSFCHPLSGQKLEFTNAPAFL